MDRRDRVRLRNGRVRYLLGRGFRVSSPRGLSHFQKPRALRTARKKHELLRLRILPANDVTMIMYSHPFVWRYSIGINKKRVGLSKPTICGYVQLYSSVTFSWILIAQGWDTMKRSGGVDMTRCSLWNLKRAKWQVLPSRCRSNDCNFQLSYK